jgi:cytochrome c biogenesis protein ResB
MAENTLPRQTAASTRGWSRSFGLLNPLRAAWWLFTNVRFAVVLLAVLCALSLLGVVLPQMPLNVRGDIVAERQWLELQEGRFGFLTSILDRAQLFDVFHARWFAVLLGLTSISTGAYVLSRVPVVLRAITQPRKRVPERYFDMAPDRLNIEGAIDVDRLVTVLRRSRYSVDRSTEPGATYLFADRFAWAQVGSLLTHVAVIVFILAAVVSKADSFESPLFLSEGATLPVFPVRDADQIQVELRNAEGEFAQNGQPLDYHADLTLYRRGDEVKQCASTVNTPCTYDGYKFYQSAYFGFGAGMEVRDLATGNVLYRETLALTGISRSPHVTIRDPGGMLLLDESLVLTDELDTGDFTYRGTIVDLPDGRLLTVGLQTAQSGEEHLAVLEPGDGEGLVRLSLAAGETGESGGLAITYASTAETPSAVVSDLPLPPEVAADGLALQLTNVVYGTARTSEGDTVATTRASGPPLLTIGGLTSQALTLRPGESSEIGGYRYTFLGQREFAGITVRRDRSDYLVWAGVLLIVLGLMATFWVPRRRFWARITQARASFAGQAPSHAKYTRELRALAQAAGARLPEEKLHDD